VPRAAAAELCLHRLEVLQNQPAARAVAMDDGAWAEDEEASGASLEAQKEVSWGRGAPVDGGTHELLRAQMVRQCLVMHVLDPVWFKPNAELSGARAALLSAALPSVPLTPPRREPADRAAPAGPAQRERAGPRADSRSCRFVAADA
jgi:hypothetical protein